MEKRKLIIGAYDTTVTGLWTLSACQLTKAEQVQTFVEVPGRYAPIDLSTYLTDGQPYYSSAALDATLESSEGDRSERFDRIMYMVGLLDGRTWQIVHPDHPGRYLVGRVQVYQMYNDLAHCAVRVAAVCEPWLYNADATTVALTATTTAQTVDLLNYGTMPVVPTVVVSGTATLVWGENTWTLSTGTYNLPDLCLMPGTGNGQPGETGLTYSGSGTVTITYREAVLAI